MTRHTIKTALTRFVLIVSIAVSIGVGSVGIGGTAEVAAMPRDCQRLLAAATMFHRVGAMWEELGYVNEAYHFFLQAHHYDNQYLDCLG